MPDLHFETIHGRNDGRVICGVDEVGRGPLAGPVLAAAAIIPPEGLPPDIEPLIRDSKKLSPRQREKLFPALTATCPHAVASCSVQEIDEMNILVAALTAMTRAITALPLAPDHVLIDGNKTPQNLPYRATPIVKGDDKSLSIAVASIIAKVTRDRFMADLAKDYPAYGWDKNAGYGTATHMKALETFGPTCWHRVSFAPVRRLKR